MPEHPFWFIMTVGCVAWYAIVTGYVAVRGLQDIRYMLQELEKMNEEKE